MNQHSPFPSVFAILQSLLDKLPRLLELSQQVLIFNIIDLNAQLIVLLPVLKVLEIILQDRDNVGDASLAESILSA